MVVLDTQNMQMGSIGARDTVRYGEERQTLNAMDEM
jgi:hypothetical protein